jgi:hypothetical protein
MSQMFHQFSCEALWIEEHMALSKANSVPMPYIVDQPSLYKEIIKNSKHLEFPLTRAAASFVNISMMCVRSHPNYANRIPRQTLRM